MIPKTVVLAALSADETSAFAAAELLGKRWETHTTCLQLAQIPDLVTGDAALAAPLWAEVMTQSRAQAAEERARMEKRLAGFQSLSELVTVEGVADDLARATAMRALHADLTIMEQADRFAGTEVFEAALFKSGRPVLLMPHDWNGAAIGRRILVAWKAKREAARAVADAAPFMDGAEQVHVLTVDDAAAFKGDTFAGYDVSTVLSRHGLKVSLRQMDSMGRTAETVLLEQARDVDADLIVLGGYGHSRLREFVLGGVTRALTRSAPIPILISH
jgi:nucleotide-binding universal stress UspA family protein